MIAYIFQTTICLFGFYLLYILFLQKETFFQFNRWYLLGTSIASLIIPFLPELLQNEEPLFASGLAPVSISINELSNALGNEANPNWHWTDFLLIIYALGVLIMLSKLVKGLFDIYLLHKNSEVLFDEGVTLRITKKPHLPFSFFKTIYFFKNHGLEKEELKKIITHESTHAKEWHSLDILFLELMGCMLWMNPMVLFYRKLIKDIHEYLADATVLKHAPLNMYGQLLLSQKHSGIQLALANNFFHSQLKNRINMMTRKPSHKWARIKYLAILPLLLIIISLFSFQQRSTDENIASEKLENVLEEINVVGYSSTEIDKENGDPPYLIIIAGQKYDPELKIENINPEDILRMDVKKDLSSEEMGQYVKTDLRDIIIIHLKPGAKIDKSKNYDEKIKINSKEKSSDTESQGEVFKVVEEMPRFPGCEENGLSKEELSKCAQTKMLEHIYMNIKYPAAARKAGIQGQSVVQFIIETDGSVSNINIIRDIGGETAEAVTKVVESMNQMDKKWIPGKRKGKNVRVQYLLPIKFKLDDNGTKETDKVDASSDKPVFVIDGKQVPWGEKELNEQIDPDDIATVDVVKNPNQSEIETFGMEAKNGIIYITLKGGKSELKVIRDRIHPIAKEAESKSSDALFKVVEEMPRFPGCENQGLEGQELKDCSNSKMFNFIFENVKYPKDAKERGDEGMVVTQFTIEKDGSLSGIKVVRDPGAELSQAALDVIYKMNAMPEKWIPGKQRGKTVRVQFTLPISFKLEGEKVIESQESNQVEAADIKIPSDNKLALADFSVQPNPSKGSFTIKFVADPGPISLTIVDLNGKVIYNRKDVSFNGVYNRVMKFEHLASGVYVINIDQHGKSFTAPLQIVK